MGGSVVIGIRRRNGDVYLAERWTNPTPYWFNDPAFYEDETEAVVQQYIDMPREEENDPTEINPSGYGVILVDLIKRRVISRQGYTSIGEVYFYASDEDKTELTQKILDRGIVTKIVHTPWDDLTTWGTPDEHGRITLDAAAIERFRQQFPNVGKGSFEIAWALPGLEVSDIRGQPGYLHWQDVLDWVAQNEWPTPIMSLEEVNEAYKEQLEA